MPTRCFMPPEISPGRFFIWDAWNSSLISDIILALVYVGVIGFLLDRVVAFMGKLIGRGTVSV